MKTGRLQSKVVGPRFQVRPRIYHGENIVMGPGKADLLDAIREGGSISAAARAMGMSYMRAWTLIRTMNQCFKEPLVQAKRGGTERGIASLTASGTAVLALYRRIETKSLQASRLTVKQLSKYLR